LQPFVPLIRNPHLLTVLTHFWKPRLDVARFPVERFIYQSEPGTRLLILRQRPIGPPRGRLVLLHGLEGSSDAAYMVSMAARALDAGFAVDRFNLRSCGESGSLSETMYHGGLTVDVHAYIASLAEPVFLIGYSLGGNVALKLAGELGAAASGLLAGVCALSTPIDLGVCVRRIEARQNHIYQARFVGRMKRRLRERGIGGINGVRTIFEIDDRFTAPAFGFRDAAHYYATQSSLFFIERITVATLLVQAKDDPLVPFGLFETAAVRGNPAVQLIAPDHGGHLGFFSRHKPRIWSDGVLLDWIHSRLNGHRPPA